MAKATHQGTCQVCGRRHKLPGGVLSTHGYTVEWGFFNGVCRGTGHLPYEQDCSLIKDSIEWAKDEIVKLAGERDALLAEASEAETILRLYVEGSANERGGKRHEIVKVKVREIQRNGYSAVEFSRDGEKWFDTYRLGLSYGVRTAREFCDLHRKKHADRIQQQIIMAQHYIDEQQVRVDNWKPRPLIEIK